MLAQLRSALAALPDALTALVFLAAWIAPLHWGRELVGNLMLVMLLEFLVVHSGGFIGQVVLSPAVSRAAKTAAVVGFGAFYMIFVLAFSLAFHRPWAVAAFTWLLFGKLVTVWLSPVPPAREVQRQKLLWGVSVMLYLAGVFATTLLPLPRPHLHQLHWLGISTLGQYAALPAAGVSQRFGAGGSDFYCRR